MKAKDSNKQKYTTITCTVVKRVQRERGQSIRIAHAYGYVEDDNGQLRHVKFDDCWLPFEWYNKKNQRKQLSFREDTPEEVQVYNPVTKRADVHYKRFKFFIPSWLVRSADNPKGNLKKQYVSYQTQMDLFNDDNPMSIIEEQSADYTQSLDERALDMRGLQTQMFDSPINISQEINEEFDAYSYGID